MKLDDQERVKRNEVQKNDSFANWLNESMVKMGISMIPAGEHQDTLKMLLRSAFDAGYGAGGASVIMDMIGSMMDKKSK